MSNKKTVNAIENVMIKNEASMVIEGAKFKRNKPNQDVKGPGITGKKLPTIPSIIKKPASDIKIRSICKNMNFMKLNE
jgi:hypothetical protein